MAYPNFNEEKKLWRQGIDVVVGLDEVGRGPLAGPVVAAAVLISKSEFRISNKIRISEFSKHISKLNHSKFIQNSKLEIQNLGIRDSKQLSEKKREQMYGILVNHPAIRWGIGIVSEKVIDKINILEATKLAMKTAVEHLGENIDFLLIDGNFGLDINIPQRSIIKGDQKVFSISAASIIAKVTRDRLMQKMHKKYPGYGFASHKGYGTALHIKSLKNFGPCKIHRKSFYPVSSF